MYPDGAWCAHSASQLIVVGFLIITVLIQSEKNHIFG